jgi:predicted transposase YbfD/YdcC
MIGRYPNAASFGAAAKVRYRTSGLELLWLVPPPLVFKPSPIRKCIGLFVRFLPDQSRQFVTAPLPETMTEFKKEWRGLNSIGRAMTMVEQDGEMTAEIRYYILSIPPKVKTFAAANRGHWSIENSLHWVLDVTFKEDASQIRTGHVPENFGFLRRFAIS